MSETANVAIKGTNDGYNIKGNGLVDLKIVFDASQIMKVMSMFQFIGKSFKLYAKLADGKTCLGEFTINNFKVDNDAETKLSLRSNTENGIIDAVSKLYSADGVINFMFVGNAA